MKRTKRGRALSLLLLIVLFPPSAVLAYEPDEVRAIVIHKPENPPAGARRIILATQRSLGIVKLGELQCEDHLLWMAGPAGPEDRGRTRWTYRLNLEEVRMTEGWVHRNGGAREAIPPDSAHSEACAAAGEGGYPGIADYVVSPPPLRAGDVVEIKVTGIAHTIYRPDQYMGEHRFADRDSVIESELRFRFSNEMPLLTWWFGNVPPAGQSNQGSTIEARWLLGNLPPDGGGTARTITSRPSVTPPDSLGPPVLRFGFRTTWERIELARLRFWRRALAATPDDLVAASHAILTEQAEPAARADAAIAWVLGRLAPIEIPAARLWYEPADLGAICAKRIAIPRDRAAALVWLLRRVGVAADAATVCSGRPLVQDLPFPQQLDAWVVLVRPGPGQERWIDLRVPTASSTTIPLPRGKALLWTVEEGEPVLVDFPGSADTRTEGRP